VTASREATLKREGRAGRLNTVTLRDQIGVGAGGRRPPALLALRPGAAVPPGRPGGAGKMGKPAWCRPGGRQGTLPFEGGCPRLLHKHEPSFF